MANWDFVFAYDNRASEWLTEQGFPHPPVQLGNRLPTTGDLKWAIGSRIKSIDDYPLIIENFEWDDDDFVPDDAFKLRGDIRLELELLIRLCERSGQLWVYMDTGQPSIVLDETLDAEHVAAIHNTASEMEDGWEYFHREMYG